MLVTIGTLIQVRFISWLRVKYCSVYKKFLATAPLFIHETGYLRVTIKIKSQWQWFVKKIGTWSVALSLRLWLLNRFRNPRCWGRSCEKDTERRLGAVASFCRCTKLWLIWHGILKNKDGGCRAQISSAKDSVLVCRNVCCQGSYSYFIITRIISWRSTGWCFHLFLFYYLKRKREVNGLWCRLFLPHQN